MGGATIQGNTVYEHEYLIGEHLFELNIFLILLWISTSNYRLWIRRSALFAKVERMKSWYFS